MLPIALLVCSAVLNGIVADAHSLQSRAPVTATQLAVPEPSIKLPADLARVLTDYETAWSSRDPKALAALFAEDGYVLPGGRPPVHGREAIEKHYTGSGGPLSLRAIAFSIDGSTGFILGCYATRPGEADIGKFTLTLRKGQDGRWMIYSDMDNSSRQPRG